MVQRKFLEKIVKTRKSIAKKTGLKIPIPERIRKFAYSKISIPESIVIMGNKIFLAEKSIVSAGLALNGIWEETETELVKKLIKKNDLVVDIGANIGYFSLIFAKLVGPGGKVFSFEPELENLNLLKKNIEVNGYKNVIIENTAISDSDGKTKLYLSKNDRGHHRISQSEKQNKNAVTVTKITLDQYFEKKTDSKKISFIKIDVEGSEIGVLKGMTSILQGNNNLKLLVEYCPNHILDYGAKPEEFVQILKTNGFNIYQINPERKILEPVSEKILLNIPAKSCINLICKKD